MWGKIFKFKAQEYQDLVNFSLDSILDHISFLKASFKLTRPLGKMALFFVLLNLSCLFTARFYPDFIYRQGVFLTLLFLAVAYLTIFISSFESPGLFLVVLYYFSFYGLGLTLGLDSWVPFSVLLIGMIVSWFLCLWNFLDKLPRLILFLGALLVSFLITYISPLRQIFYPFTFFIWIIGGILVYFLQKLFTRRRPIGLYIKIFLFVWLIAGFIYIYLDPGRTELYAALETFLEGLLPLVGLLWFLAGLEIVNFSMHLGKTLFKLGQKIVPRNFLSFFQLILFLEVAVSQLFLYEEGIKLPWGILPLSYVIVYTWSYHAYLAGLILILFLVWNLKPFKKWPDFQSIALQVYLVTLVILYAYFTKFFAFQEGYTFSSVLTFILYLCALFLPFSGLWLPTLKATTRNKKIPFYLNFLVGLISLMAAVSFFEMMQGEAYFNETVRLEPFMGLIFLGVPYLGLVILHKILNLTLDLRKIIGLFLRGMVFGAVLVCLDYYGGLKYLEFWVLVFILALIALRKVIGRQTNIRQTKEIVFHALTVGLGFASYYLHPLYIPLAWLEMFFLRSLREAILQVRLVDLYQALSYYLIWGIFFIFVGFLWTGFFRLFRKVKI